MKRLVTAALLLVAGPALAEPTAVTVRVIAEDAKFIGTSMGGARVTIREAATGAVLAQGVTAGATGDTKSIMQAQGRNPARVTEGVAHFSATLDIARPTLVVLEAEGPLGHPGSVLRVTEQRWLVPGKPVTLGDGWVVELPGLVITPQVKAEGGKAVIAAKVELMCGCPITPGGLWDAADYRVEATLWRDGKALSRADLAFTTAPGGYGGALPLSGKGAYRLGLFAQNVRTGNSNYVELPLSAD